MILALPVITLSAATLLAGAGIVLAFFPRIPAALLSFAAMLVATLSGMVTFDSTQLWFWGVAALMAGGISWLVPALNDVQGRCYTVGAALVGALVGLLGGTAAWVIIASAAGAFLGYLAYSRTPRGIAAGIAVSRMERLAALALPAVVNFSMVMLIFAQLIMS